MALLSSLRWIEKNLRSVSQQFEKQRASSTILFYKTNDLEEQQQEKIKACIKSMLDEIKQMAQEYHLSAREESLRADTRSRLGEIWVVLEDLRPEKLEEFGKLSADDRDSLGKHIGSLLNQVRLAKDELYNQ